MPRGVFVRLDSFLESPTPSLVAMAMINQTRTQTPASLPASRGLGQASGALGHGDLPFHFAVQPVSLPGPWCPQAEWGSGPAGHRASVLAVGSQELSSGRERG